MEAALCLQSSAQDKLFLLIRRKNLSGVVWKEEGCDYNDFLFVLKTAVVTLQITKCVPRDKKQKRVFTQILRGLV